jgi:hypothetical protein
MTMRIIAFLAFMVMLWVGADAGLAYAQDRAPTANPAVREEVTAWLSDAAAFRDGAQETARLWQRDNAPLLEVRTDIFVAEAEAFVEVTQTYVQHLRGLASGSDVASVLREISADVTERLEALAEARPRGASAVVRELSEIDQAVYDGFLTFGADDQLQAQASSPIRVTYVTASAE